MHSIPERCGDVNHKIEIFLLFFCLSIAYDFATHEHKIHSNPRERDADRVAESGGIMLPVQVYPDIRSSDFLKAMESHQARMERRIP
jgi:hypothetical protein